MSHVLISYVLCVFPMCNNGFRVFMSKLTELLVKSNRLVFSGNVCMFWWYLTGASAFDGILRKVVICRCCRTNFPLVD